MYLPPIIVKEQIKKKVLKEPAIKFKKEYIPVVARVTFPLVLSNTSLVLISLYWLLSTDKYNLKVDSAIFIPTKLLNFVLAQMLKNLNNWHIVIRKFL